MDSIMHTSGHTSGCYHTRIGPSIRQMYAKYIKSYLQIAKILIAADFHTSLTAAGPVMCTSSKSGIMK